MEYGKDYTVYASFDNRCMNGTKISFSYEEYTVVSELLNDVYLADPDAFESLLFDALQGINSFGYISGYSVWLDEDSIMHIVSKDPDMYCCEIDINEFVRIKNVWLEKRNEFISEYGMSDFVPVEERIGKVKEHIMEEYGDPNVFDEGASYIFPLMYKTKDGWKEYYLYFYTIYFGYTDDGEVYIYLYDLENDENIIKAVTGFKKHYYTGDYPVPKTEVTNEQLNYINNMFNSILCQKEFDMDGLEILNDKYKYYLTEEIIDRDFHKYMDERIFDKK